MIARRFSKAVLIAGGWAFVTALNMILLPARYAVRVTSESVAAAPMALVVRAPGNLDAKASVTLKAQFDGELKTKQYREGQQVKAGELIAVISRDKIRLDHQEKQDALANAKSDLATARKEVQLQKNLYNKQAVAYSAVEDAQRALVKATQALRAAEGAWKLEVLRWESSNVISPIAGTVVKDSVSDDKTVSAGKEIVTIADVSEFTVKARVDELDIKRVSEYQPAEVRLQIYPDKAFKAHVTQIGTQSDTPDSTAIGIVLKLDDTQGVLLRPKLTADVRIITGKTPPIVSVPLTAINNADGNTRVWILGLGKRIRSQTVTLGQTNPDRVEVKQGLRPGDRICATTDAALAEGMRVVVESSREDGQNRSLIGACRILWARLMNRGHS